MNKKGKKTFNWGIIGTGGIANAFSKDLGLLKNHMVTAVLSRTMRNAQNFSNNLVNCKAYNNIDLFLEDEDICAVYIATLILSTAFKPLNLYKLRFQYYVKNHLL